MTIKHTGENAYFAASNSTSGFCSYYAEIFDAARIGHVYAVKGGPGTGKSRFLRDVAEAGEGHGQRCEYIYCSSDPTSLDGIILTDAEGKSIALLDATAPHVYEPKLPGVREEIVDLGAFWSASELGERREEIESLNRQKSDAYRRAYRYLSGYGEITHNRDALVAPYIKQKKLEAFAERLIMSIPRGKGYTVAPALMHSIGMRGEVGFDTYFAGASRIYLIEDCRGAAGYLMQALGELCREWRLSVRVSHDPVEYEKIDGLFLRESGVAFAVCPRDACKYPHKTVRMRRFIDVGAMKSVRSELLMAERMRKATRAAAVDALEKVRELHFRLEEIYMASMDFDAKERFTAAFCEKLFGDEK